MNYTTEKKYSGGTVSISVGLPAEIKLKLDALAEASRISRNKLIVSAIVTMLKQYGKE
jgi:predicted transcriptional regulator